MLRTTGFAIAVLAAASGAVAQSAPDPVVDFILRPSDVDEGLGDDIWSWDTEPEEAAIEGEIGPPMAGPTGEELIGPPLVGPLPEPDPERARRRTRLAEEEPFAPTGINLGPFVIRPSIETGVIATDNAAGGPEKTSAVGLAVVPEVNIRSESERLELEANLTAEGVFYDEDQFDERTAEARARARYDLTSRTSLDAEAGYARTQDGFTDDDTPGGAAERPNVDGFDAALGVTQRFGRFSARLGGFVERALHEDVPLTGGGTASREELDNTEFGLRLRGGYDAGGMLRPFVEVAAGRREFDQSVDDSGFERSGFWGEMRGGIVINRGSKLSGEISLGYRREDLEDSRLEDLDVFLANAAILWSPQRLTEVRLDLATSTSPTSVPDVSGTILHSGTLTLARRFTPRVRGEVGVGLDYERPVGDDWRDLTFTGFAGASYAFNRTASLVGRYVYERTDSNDPSDESEAHTVSLRVRLQR